MTHIQIIITDESGRKSGARVLSTDTAMTQTEAVKALSVMVSILRHYVPEAHQPAGDNPPVPLTMVKERKPS
jgi:hypothetical protein